MWSKKNHPHLTPGCNGSPPYLVISKNLGVFRPLIQRSLTCLTYPASKTAKSTVSYFFVVSNDSLCKHLHYFYSRHNCFRITSKLKWLPCPLENHHFSPLKVHMYLLTYVFLAQWVELFSKLVF